LEALLKRNDFRVFYFHVNGSISLITTIKGVGGFTSPMKVPSVLKAQKENIGFSTLRSWKMAIGLR